MKFSSDRAQSRATAGRIAALLAAVMMIPLCGTATADQFPLSKLLPGGKNQLQNPADTCPNGEIRAAGLLQGGSNSQENARDLIVKDGVCRIKTKGTFYYKAVNILDGGTLEFDEPTTTDRDINFWASSIIIENGGKLVAGSAGKPFGSNGGTLTVYLYGEDQSKGLDPVGNNGKNQGKGALCKTPLSDGVGPCGIPTAKKGADASTAPWSDNGAHQFKMPGAGAISDYFYQYGPLYGDGLCDDGSVWNAASNPCPDKVGYFGYKVLAVSYGGSLQLFGYKGTPLTKPAASQGNNGGGGSPRNLLANLGMSGAPATSGSAAAGDQPSKSLLDYYRELFSGHGGGSGGGSGGGTPPHSGGSSGGSSGPACAQGEDTDPLYTGCSWLRLAANLPAKTGQLMLSAAVGDKWGPKDKIVVTTTDYLPGHSEELTIDKISGTTVTFESGDESKKNIWPHNGQRYSFAGKVPQDVQTDMIAAGMDSNMLKNGAETRAAVALLTRSIRIVSGGDNPGQTFEQAGNIGTNCKEYAPGKKQAVPYCYYFGGHVVFRQGFEQVKVQGVEFADLGQGGKIGHYPIHFHMARHVPTDTFIKDSSINESMTRWIVLHSTQGVLLQRNVGWKSIGHGFYLENGTETDNKFYSNLGIFARAAVDNAQNPRKVPGILAYTADNKFRPNLKNEITDLPGDPFPWRTDFQHPSNFWITNLWNDFQGNMAAGAGACGAGYWFVPAWNSDMVEVPTASNQQFGMHMKWTGYEMLQRSSQYAGSTPLERFSGNFATSTMSSIQTIATTVQCFGADWPGDPAAGNPGHFPGVASFAPKPYPGDQTDSDMYYPHIGGGGRLATLCKVVDGKNDCTDFTPDRKDSEQRPLAPLGPCTHGDSLPYCAVTVIDHFTTSFHWAETNFSAIWLRPYWYLVDNLFLSDVQNGGISFITSGTYDRAAVIDGEWSVVRTSAFVGDSQGDPSNPNTSSAGPFMNGIANSKNCENGTPPTQSCLVKDEGVSFPLSNFGTGQRLFSIYDGPAYQEANLYLDIPTSPCPNCMYAGTLGFRKQFDDPVKKEKDKFSCYLPNAAIGWKQPNGFFYPPSFHSSKLFFYKVAIRHYVIDALFQPGGYLEDKDKVEEEYCKPLTVATYPDFFKNFTDIDRQTELNDDDGSLTGLSNNLTVSPTVPASLKQTISVNPADFFNAPVETAECLSNIGITPSLACPASLTPPITLPVTPTPVTARTSPYDYVTTAIFPDCAVGPGTGENPVDGRCGSMVGDTLVSTPPPRYSKANGRGGIWSQECSNPACYGVPLYRQYLTGKDGGTAKSSTGEAATWYENSCQVDPTTPKCRFPFVRMGGQSTYQRSTMTVNNGAYFVDTTASEKLQQHVENFSFVTNCDDTPAGKECSPRSVNVFQNGKTYYMFFLYAKKSMKQTYQIYVGQNFTYDLSYNPSSPTGMLRAVRSPLATLPMAQFNTIAWPGKWKVSYNKDEACRRSKPTTGCGILQITVDMTDMADLDPSPANGLCKPERFCTASGTSCGCALAKTDPLYSQCDKACGTWAVKDLDFPDAGPYGFAFTLPASPSDWSADDKGQSHRPTPETFIDQKTDPSFNWLSLLFDKPAATVPDSAPGAACYYDPAKLPGSSACPIR